MKLEYQVPAIEVLDLEDTEYCEGVNTFFGSIVLHKDCGGWGTVNNFHITGPDVCTHS